MLPDLNVQRNRNVWVLLNGISGCWSRSWLAETCRICVCARLVCAWGWVCLCVCPPRKAVFVHKSKKKKKTWLDLIRPKGPAVDPAIFSAWSPSLSAPPSLPPPSLFRMLFQLQTFQDEGISSYTHTHTHIVHIHIFLFYLPPASNAFFEIVLTLPRTL